MANGWPEGSYGEAMNEPQADNAPFKPIDPKTADVNEMAGRIVNHVKAATPSERRAGARFYDRARRDAYHVSKGVNPGLAEDPKRPGRTRDFNAVMDEHGKTEDMKSRQPGIEKAAHTIAALSPSGGGMTWRENPQAAHQLNNITPDTSAGLQSVTAAHKGARNAASALHSAKKGTKGEIKEAQGNANLAQDQFQSVNKDVRAHPDINDTHLKRTSTDTIATAHNIATGRQEGVASTVKTQAFAQNIAHPRHIAGMEGPGSQRATVDGRSHNIAVGRDLPWKTTIGLGSQGRYDTMEKAHQVAASQTGQSPHQAQATSWIQHKNSKEAAATPGDRRMNRGARGTGGEIKLGDA